MVVVEEGFFSSSCRQNVSLACKLFYGQAETVEHFIQRSPSLKYDEASEVYSRAFKDSTSSHLNRLHLNVALDHGQLVKLLKWQPDANMV